MFYTVLCELRLIYNSGTTWTNTPKFKLLTQEVTAHKPWEFRNNRARDVLRWDIYIPKISKNLHLGPRPHPRQISSQSVQRVVPAGQGPQNRRMSNLNTGICAARILPVHMLLHFDNKTTSWNLLDRLQCMSTMTCPCRWRSLSLQQTFCVTITSFVTQQPQKMWALSS